MTCVLTQVLTYVVGTISVLTFKSMSYLFVHIFVF